MTNCLCTIWIIRVSHIWNQICATTALRSNPPLSCLLYFPCSYPTDKKNNKEIKEKRKKNVFNPPLIPNIDICELFRLFVGNCHLTDPNLLQAKEYCAWKSKNNKNQCPNLNNIAITRWQMIYGPITINAGHPKCIRYVRCSLYVIILHSPYIRYVTACPALSQRVASNHSLSCC